MQASPSIPSHPARHEDPAHRGRPGASHQPSSGAFLSPVYSKHHAIEYIRGSQRAAQLKDGCEKSKARQSIVPATVLIVEDDFDTREVLATLLRIEGFTVITAQNGLAGLDAVQTERVDLIITDIEMPHLDGIEMIRRLRAQEQFRRLPIVVVSACERRLMKTAIAAGADDTMRKPARFDLLVTIVRGLLEPSEQQRKR